MNPATNALAGSFVELERRADLFDPPAAKHDDLIGERHGLGLVVGDVDHRRAHRLMEFRDFEPHLDAQLRVEVRQRLIEQEHLGLPDDRAPYRHPLALAARQFSRAAA